MLRYSPLAFVVALGVILAVTGADAARTTTYSGTVAAIDPPGGLLILNELGPWRVAQGQPVVTRRSVAITPDTKFNTFIRVNVPGAFAGDFLEVALDANDVTPGDFVTVECVVERGRLVAVRVTVAELD
ncbi:MAG TPA: hypothetical protein VHT71_03340 [Methylomirabilota bacterium]|nr:hypothetical protein [Methylomirabilota bacterium]